MASNTTSAGPFEPFLQFWQDAMSRMTGGATPATAPSNDVLQAMRRTFFDAMARLCDDYLRSPQFLEMMKQSMDHALAFRRQLNQFLTSALQAAQMPTQEDLGEIREALQSIQDGLLQRVEDLSRRVNSLDKRRTGAVRRDKVRRPARGGRRSAPRRP